MDIDFNMGDAPLKMDEKPMANETNQQKAVTTALAAAAVEVPQEETPDEPESTCVFVFISAIPGSTVLVNLTARGDGLKRDVGMIHFAPVGERKPHPIIDNAMYTDFGMYVTDDPKLAWVLNQSIEKGNAQYFAYCPTNESHVAMFQPEVYAIEIPASAA